MKKNFNGKLSELTFHIQLIKLDVNNGLMDFDATSSYSSSMYDKDSVFPKIGSGYAFKTHMNIVFVQDVNNQTFKGTVVFLLF